MKFKPIYFYGIIVLVSIIVLVLVSTQSSDDPKEIAIEQNQNMPDDDVHKQLKNPGSNTPGKQNVSEEYQKKLAGLEKTVNENPTDTIALRNYADFLSASHKMNEAIPYYEKILDVNPKRTDIYFSLALIYYNKQDFGKCEEANNKVLSFEPKNQMALYNLGAIAATQGKKDKAKEFWEMVVKIDSGSETGLLAQESIRKLMQ